jgi:cytochrome oxidase Cu insertion factor (SCO1/SenC/PrrC family)
VGAALVAAGAVALLSGRVLGRVPEPPRMSALPAFRLTERSGRPLSLADLRGRPWVADFIFTQCAGACPAMTARMARLRRDLSTDVAFVSFTVDPAHDTPEVLARYAATFRADESWHFLTGAQKDLYDLSVGGFKLAAMEVPPADKAAGGDGPFLHSSKFVLVDAEGVIRGYYDSTDEQALRALVADAGVLQASR